MAELQRKVESERETSSEGWPHFEAFSFGDLADELMDGLRDGIKSEVHKAIMIGPGGIYVGRPRRGPEREKPDFSKVATALETLANEHRLKVLDSLMTGGMYASDLEKEFSSIGPSTLSAHLKILEEAGLIAQEGSRGRYLITIPGRIALKLAARMARLSGPRP